jgi:hypothetical protein
MLALRLEPDLRLHTSSLFDFSDNVSMDVVTAALPVTAAADFTLRAGPRPKSPWWRKRAGLGLRESGEGEHRSHLQRSSSLTVCLSRRLRDTYSDL